MAVIWTVSNDFCCRHHVPYNVQIDNNPSGIGFVDPHWRTTGLWKWATVKFFLPYVQTSLVGCMADLFCLVDSAAVLSQGTICLLDFAHAALLA